MYLINEFKNRGNLDSTLAKNIANVLAKAVSEKGHASIAVSGGSTPKGFFSALSSIKLPWNKITIMLADERWVPLDDSASNTRLVHENLLQNKAVKANFFHIKQGDEFSTETLEDLNVAVDSSILPLDVLILGMGEDGHTASLFPCSEQIDECFSSSADSLIKVVPKSAPHQRVTFSFSALKQSKHIFLHICSKGKKGVLNDALAGTNIKEMPIRAFLQDPNVNTNVYWAE